MLTDHFSGIQQPPSKRGIDPHVLGTATLRELAIFCLFFIAYYLPLLLDGSGLAISEPRIRLLFDDLLKTPQVHWDIAREIVGHLLLLVPTYLLLSLLSKQLSAASKISHWLARLLVLAAGWAFLVANNARLFPKSDYSYAFYALARPELAYGLGILFGIGCLFIVVSSVAARRWPLLGVVGLASCAIGLGSGTPTSLRTDAPTARNRPTERNIIIVGIDSLSQPAFDRLRTSLPHIDQLMKSGVSYQRAYTPLGRTFPAWMSILSGGHAADHGAICNLRSLEHVEKRNLISTELQSQGFHTVYAIDERRFNNLDESFGFDDIVGPTAGALDFVLQRVNDTPLTNAIMQTSLGRTLMPYSYVNTASYANYDADGFVGSVLRATAGAEKLFLAVHFETAHFPFKTRHATKTITGPNRFWNAHAEALTAVDQQVGQLMSGLAQRGYLNNALVVVLSDHGEGLGEHEASITLGGNPFAVREYGHGGSILGDQQNHIILGVVDFRNGKPLGGSVDHKQVSLIDLRPLMSEYLRNGSTVINPANKCLIVETGVRFAAAIDYKTLNETQMAASTAGLYRIDASGRLQLREESLLQIVNSKDIGWRCEDRLTYFSFTDKRYFTIELDANGVPSVERKPVDEDIRHIEAYRKRLVESLDKANPS